MNVSYLTCIASVQLYSWLSKRNLTISDTFWHFRRITLTEKWNGFEKKNSHEKIYKNRIQ